MKKVPFKVFRVSYLYGFRFVDMPLHVIDELEKRKKKPPDKYRALNGFGRVYWNKAEGFQPYIKTPSDTVKFSTRDVDLGVYRNEDKEAEDPYLKKLTELESLRIVDHNQKSSDNGSIIHGLFARCHREINLNKYGLGTYCLSLIFSKSDFSLAECLDILNMAETMRLESDPSWRFSIVPEKLWTKRQEYAAPIAAWVARDVEAFKKWIEETIYRNKKSLKKSIYWLCRDGDGDVIKRNLICKVPSENKFLKDVQIPVQNPYVYIELQTNSIHDYKEYIKENHNECGDDCLQGILQKMLIRVGSTGLDHWKINRGYLHRHRADNIFDTFPNLYPLDYLFINTHFRSTLVVFPPLDHPKAQTVCNAIRLFNDALRDTVREVRSRWYYLVTEQAYIDELVRLLDEKWQEDPKLTKPFLDVQHRLLKIRFHVGNILEMPVIHRRAASSLNELYIQLSNAFSMDYLQKNLREKLKQTVEIYNESLNIRLSEKYRDKQI